MRPELKRFTDREGREFGFLFTMQGMIAAENAADAAFSDVVAGAFNKRIGHLGALIYGGMVGAGERVTYEQCCAMIEPEGEALGIALWGALESAMPERKDGGARPPAARSVKAPRGTGPRSSPRGSKKG